MEIGCQRLKRALTFLLGRFSGRVLKTGEHLVLEAALEALPTNLPFTGIIIFISSQSMFSRRALFPDLIKLSANFGQLLFQFIRPV